jgi:TonB family protein
VPERTAHSVSVVLRAAILSSSLHALALVGVGWVTAHLPPGQLSLGGDELPLIIPPWQIDPADVDVTLAEAEQFDLSKADVPLRPVLPEADLSTFDPNPRRRAEGAADRAPAPDDGGGPGRPTELAWRNDSTTLRARPSDGALIYQNEREQTGHEATSPQAARQEPRVGIGDSSRTKRPRTEARPPVPILPIETGDDEDDDARVTIEEPPLSTAALGPGSDLARGDGPLAVDEGRRSFDVTQYGDAQEIANQRAASNEMHPGLTDFSAPSSAKGEGRVGQGPASVPGISKLVQEGTGTAPHEDAPRSNGPIGAVGEGSDERVYAREHMEIRQRVAKVLKFPRRLAVMLEQGEAIILFVVERDGRVSGDVKLVKSAGFEEFDREAVDVVRRAAPFPALPKKLLVRMRIPFENPMIQ